MREFQKDQLPATEVPKDHNKTILNYAAPRIDEPQKFITSLKLLRLTLGLLFCAAGVLTGLWFSFISVVQLWKAIFEPHSLAHEMGLFIPIAFLILGLLLALFFLKWIGDNLRAWKP
jgi:hypothetical protein